MESKVCEAESLYFKGHSFLFEEARIVYRIFIKFGDDKKDEKNILILFHLDVTIAFVVESLSQAFEDTQDHINSDRHSTVPGNENECAIEENMNQIHF